MTSQRFVQRFNEAMSRKAERNKLSPEQQLARLDFRLGKGEGAEKERERLNKIIEVRKAKKSVTK